MRVWAPGLRCSAGPGRVEGAATEDVDVLRTHSSELLAEMLTQTPPLSPVHVFSVYWIYGCVKFHSVLQVSLQINTSEGPRTK